MQLHASNLPCGCYLFNTPQKDYLWLHCPCAVQMIWLNYQNTLTDEFVDVKTYHFEMYITSLITPQAFERNAKKVLFGLVCTNYVAF